MGSSDLAVLVRPPVGQTLTKPDNMTKLLFVLVLIPCCFGARRLRGNAQRAIQETRDERSLLGSFPFNQKAEAHGDHGDDGVDVSFNAIAAAGPGPNGKKCIDKVEMVEETEYDDVVTCDHSYDKRCHTTYVTNFESQQEEECEENFRKSCFIEYSQIAFNETVEV